MCGMTQIKTTKNQIFTSQQCANTILLPKQSFVNNKIIIIPEQGDTYLHNQMLYDFGINPNDFGNKSLLHKKINEIGINQQGQTLPK